VTEIEREAEAATAAGLDAELVDDTPLPFEVAGAVRLDQQAEFDPVAYLRGLADAVDQGERSVFEHTRVLAIDGDELKTPSGRVRAERVIVATHLPIVDRVGLFARAEPQASFAITARTPDRSPAGMFISSGSHPHSLRGMRHGDAELLIVAGEGHRIGSGSPRRSIAALEGYARERFGATSFPHRWDAHDFVTEDRLPFVGSVSPRSDRVLTATGMNKWGLALGSACAAMLADSIGGADRAWPEEFDSRRLPGVRSWPSLIRHGAETGAHFTGDRLKLATSKDLAPGEGRVIGTPLGQHATYRDDRGTVHELSARCTHLGCIVAWNPVAKTWDCPCHGSRFDAASGEVLEGPAKQPLERKGF
jgi:glycine/D-amino acid oxidase-like deaminating enzyme/nitrite reductase/ring-hydroxylating ferredoxin subunit